MIFNPYSSIDNLEEDLNFLDSVQGYGVSISKNLKVHDSTAIRESLLAEGRLKLVPFYQGYHEYIIDNDVARVYKMITQNIFIYLPINIPRRSLKTFYNHFITKST